MESYARQGVLVVVTAAIALLAMGNDHLTATIGREYFAIDMPRRLSRGKPWNVDGIDDLVDRVRIVARCRTSSCRLLPRQRDSLAVGVDLEDLHANQIANRDHLQRIVNEALV